MHWSAYIDISSNTRCPICDGETCPSCKNGVQVFGIYHRRRMIPWLYKNEPAPVRDDFTLVAHVEVGSLDDAFRITQHIDDDWTSAPGVQMHVERARSSSVGDVFQTPDGALYRVAPMGFEPVDKWDEWPVKQAVRNADLTFLNTNGDMLISISADARMRQVRGCIILIEVDNHQYQLFFASAEDVDTSFEHNDPLYWDIMAMVSAYDIQQELVVCFLRQDDTSSAYRTRFRGEITSRRMKRALTAV